jgi:hypothetical protein
MALGAHREDLGFPILASIYQRRPVIELRSQLLIEAAVARASAAPAVTFQNAQTDPRRYCTIIIFSEPFRHASHKTCFQFARLRM